MKLKCADIIADPSDNTSRGELNRMNPQDCTGLAQSIDRDGQLQPVLVKRHGDLYRLAAGFRRFVAVSVVLAWEEIEAKIIPDDADPHKINGIENLHRKDTTFWEQCCMLREVYPPDTAMKDIERELSMSKSWVNTRWKAWLLPDEVKGQIEAGLLGFTDVAMLVQNNVDAEQAAAKLLAGKAAGKTTHQMRKEVTSRKVMRGKKQIQQVMTWCLKMNEMKAVQALRFAIGEIEESTLKNWFYESKEKK